MGSYNFTGQASSRNWESMIRVKDNCLTEEFKNEFEKMWLIGTAVKQKLKYDYCSECNQKVEDPLTHFGIILNTCSFFSWLDDEDTYSVTCNGTTRFCFGDYMNDAIKTRKQWLGEMSSNDYED